MTAAKAQTLNIYTTNGDTVKVFEPIGKQTKGGQRSGIAKEIYRIQGDEKKAWSIKDTRVLQEYLGYTAFKAMGVEVGEFFVGYIDPNGFIDSSKQVFLYQYLEDTENFTIAVNTTTLLDHNPSTLIPIFVVSLILGDPDGTGKANDNFLVKTGFSSQTGIKIDCGRVFEILHSEILDFKKYFGQFEEFANFVITSPVLLSEVLSYLKQINIEYTLQMITMAYQQFEEIMKTTPNFQRSQRRPGFYVDKNPSKDGAIVYLDDPKLLSIDDLTTKLRERFSAIKAHIQNMYDSIHGEMQAPTDITMAKLITDVRERSNSPVGGRSTQPSRDEVEPDNEPRSAPLPLQRQPSPA